MININSDEARSIRKKFPYVHIRRTTNRYYMEEQPAAMRWLKSFRGERNKKHTNRGERLGAE